MGRGFFLSVDIYFFLRESGRAFSFFGMCLLVESFFGRFCEVVRCFFSSWSRVYFVLRFEWGSEVFFRVGGRFRFVLFVIWVCRAVISFWGCGISRVSG